MSLDGISGFHQEGNLWLPNQPERKEKENINFSEEFRKEQIRQKVKDRIAKMPQPQLTTEAQAAYNNAQQASNVWTQNKNLVPSQPKKIGGAIKNSKQAMYDRLFDAQKTSTSPIFPTKDAGEYGKMLEQNPVIQPEPKVPRQKPPVSGVVMADRIAEKQIKINELNKEIEALKKQAKEPNANGYKIANQIAEKQIKANILNNELNTLKAQVQTPQIKNPVEPAVQKKPYVKPSTTTRPAGNVVVDPSGQDNVKNTKPSRQERLKEIRNNPEKRARYNKLKLAQNPELKARYESFSNFKKTKGATGALKKAGKWGAIAALAIGAGAFLLNKCSKKDDKPVEAEAPTKTVPENQETETKPVAPVKSDEPALVDETETPDAAGAVAGNATESESGNAAGNVENPEQTSENIVQNGDTLEEVANRYGITVEKLKELNADKIKKFRTADGKVIEGFRVGENISLKEDAKKVEGLKGKDEAIAEYEKELIENFENIPQAMWNQVCTPEFREKHKLGEYKEAA